MRVEVGVGAQCRTGWNQGELAQLQLGLLTLTDLIICPKRAIFAWINCNLYMITQIIIAIIFVISAIVILMGKGDSLIAGYNTASKEKKEKYNIKRLRYLVGGLLIVVVPVLFINSGETSIAKSLTVAGVIVVLCIVVVILANTWAKKRNK